jgi:hypothetical protein
VTPVTRPNKQQQQQQQEVIKMIQNHHFTKSLGTLRINKKTKLKSPDLTGKIQMHRRLIAALWGQLNANGGDQVECNLAAWNYRDKAGPLLNVEISEPYVHEEPANIFDLIAKQQEEDQD